MAQIKNTPVSHAFSMFYIEREQTDGSNNIEGYLHFPTLSAKHTNANVSAIRHVTSDATTDAKIT